MPQEVAEVVKNSERERTQVLGALLKLQTILAVALG